MSITTPVVKVLTGGDPGVALVWSGLGVELWEVSTPGCLMTLQTKQLGYTSPGQGLSSQSLRNATALGSLHTMQAVGGTCEVLVEEVDF